ncbi:MAG: hypothetical protein A2270_04660 [Elusimicrobia bacterium RIFOXYA12_FULL_51_18]|nr:MAG: hypothetical protein A2270_04660 [Elusimicrobia bacterium RIFOXYA12_FULL_51_18]OGS32868.1 MAG: hypothetical protein A2218_10715 [Elusimicrobia bacterium RIFOXYA2_FULL_53_38]
MKPILLLGGGGHAKCVINALRLSGVYAPAGILDVKARVGQKVLDVPITGCDSDLTAYFDRGVRFCCITLGSTGDPSGRIKLRTLAQKAGFQFPNIIHPSAVVSEYAALGCGNYIGPMAVVNPGALIGDHCILNTGSIIEHDCNIGDFAHIAPGAALSGGVQVGNRAHIGTGCAVMQYLKIGADSVVGAGSIVVRDIPARVICCGNPAKKIKNK